MIVSPAKSKGSRTSVNNFHLTISASVFYHNLEEDPMVNSGRRCHPGNGHIRPKGCTPVHNHQLGRRGTDTMPIVVML